MTSASCARAPVDAGLGHRTGRATVMVRRPDGTPAAGQDVLVRQTRHAFGFGSTGFDFVPLANDEKATTTPRWFGGASVGTARAVADLWFDVFNTATLPLYWAEFEPERGRTDTRRLHETARWFVDRGCAVKGHPLLWHTLTPSWLRDVPADFVEALVRARIRREVEDFGDLVRTWDAINEAVIMPVYDRQPNPITALAARLGRVETVRLAFESARAADPGLTLLLNDFNMSPAYEHLIENCLAAGIRIDGLGLQSHMHQGYWGEARTLEVLDRFARFGLPLHMTETTLLSGALMPPDVEDLNDYDVPSWPTTPEGEERQANELRRHYSTLVRHPAVQSITYWGFTDDGAWLGAPSGLTRADGSPKPAYGTLRDLIKGEWWFTEHRLTTSETGEVMIEAFAGDYAAEVAGTTVPFTVTAGADTAESVPLH